MTQEAKNGRLTVALVATGAMGAAMGQRLVEHGARVLTSLEGRSSASETRARAAGMQAVSGPDLMEADLFLSVVPPGAALELAGQFAPLLAGTSRKPLYVDCNAVNPQTVGLIAAEIAGAGADFVDAGIIGGPPRPGTPGPSIYCSGPAADATRVLIDYGLRIRQVEGPVGAASALKMSYAGITKGLIAIGSAMALGAARAGVQDALLTELGESQLQLLKQLRKMVPEMFSKSYRWVAEMQEIAGFLDGVDGGGSIYDGAAALYEHLAREFPGGPDIAALGAFYKDTGLS